MIKEPKDITTACERASEIYTGQNAASSPNTTNIAAMVNIDNENIIINTIYLIIIESKFLFLKLPAIASPTQREMYKKIKVLKPPTIMSTIPYW